MTQPLGSSASPGRDDPGTRASADASDVARPFRAPAHDLGVDPSLPDGTRWRKSSRSVDHGQCVEVSRGADAVLVRDSARPGDGHVTVAGARWAAFLRGVRAGDLDVP